MTHTAESANTTEHRSGLVRPLSVIDVTMLPFTNAMKATRYSESEGLMQGFVASGVWDRAYEPVELIEMMNRAGVSKGFLSAHTGGEWAIDYEYVAETVATAPGRLYGQAGINPDDIKEGVRRLEYAVTDLGFVGAHSYPHWFRRRPDDRTYYPFYSKCVELGIPIQIQVGKAWQAGLRNVGHPDAIDAIAVDFPDLKIVCIHTGHPWERELIAVASKHPGVFIGLDAFHPRDWAPELVDYLTNRSPQEVMAGRGKVLFGSNYPALSGCHDVVELINEIDSLGFDDETRRALLYENASRVYGIPA